MRIELRGIVQRHDQGHIYADLVVTEGGGDLYRQHHMGVDIKLNRGKILTYLSAIYGIPPGQIVWPGHIKLKLAAA